jgi:hypothetical protein
MQVLASRNNMSRNYKWVTRLDTTQEDVSESMHNSRHLLSCCAACMPMQVRMRGTGFGGENLCNVGQAVVSVNVGDFLEFILDGGSEGLIG